MTYVRVQGDVLCNTPLSAKRQRCKLKICVDGRFYEAIKSLYQDPVASVQVNDFTTGWFSTPFGVKQGDILSPTLFAIFVNDLTTI